MYSVLCPISVYNAEIHYGHTLSKCTQMHGVGFLGGGEVVC